MLIVEPRPELLRSAENLHNECGPYQLRAALNACGKDAPIADLYYSAAHGRRDWSLPWLMPGILARFGVAASWHFWSRRRFAERLKAALKRNEPVLFVIRSIRGLGRLHWISAWGYDESTDEFLCYDSQGPAASGSPAGNVRYGAKLLASRLPFKGTFALEIQAAPSK